ncbi:MAG: DUF58 domain-containing protein [Kiritimatiellaeota bacterium]|nr:DUF58 domain-containing protein [Kiritimatiellota bacterium]
MPRTRFKYLRPQDIRNLETFEFAPKALVEGYLAGRHRSNSPGPSTEFRDYREYAPGDDPCRVDWRVFARSDRHYVRTYDLETNLNTTIFLDSSASMGFGGPLTKLEYASFFAACLCYLVTRRRDRVALHLFDTAIRAFSPPGSTTGHLHDLLNMLEHNHPGERTSTAAALDRAFPLLRERGVVVLVSDFLDDVSLLFHALNRYVHAGHKVYLFHILDPAELDLPKRGLTAFVDMETGERVVAHTEAIRRAQNQALRQHIEAIRTLAVRRNVSYVLARTDSSFLTLFGHFDESGETARFA